MKKVLIFSCILMLAATVSHAQARISIDVIIGNRPPAPNEAQLMRGEEAKHPNITRAMHDIEKSTEALHNAPDDFGGHKGQAEADVSH